ncbi:MAG: hypothetical protein DHS20C09_07710 [marine bacterium B5-7]|nr:MAG: hypothetical protein DHS20C09_07710 [marine bacterium B5-7]
MLNCKEISQMSSDYLDKNLSWKESFSIKIHIAMCKHCHRFIQHLKLTVDCTKEMKEELTTTENVEHIVNILNKK